MSKRSGSSESGSSTSESLRGPSRSGPNGGYLFRRQPVPDAPGGSDEPRRAGVPLELPAKLRDVRIEGPACCAVVIAPDVAHQVTTRDRRVRARAKRQQQLVGAWRKR